VTVPDVRGIVGLQALADILGRGLTFVVVTVNDDNVAAGLVINQSPSPDSTLKAGDPVTLLVSDGPR